FVMLETIREYALERAAASGESDALRRKHAAHYLVLAEQAEPALRRGSAAERMWVVRLEPELDNLRAALRWAIEHHETETEEALRLAAALGRFWEHWGHLTEASQRLAEVLALPQSVHYPRARAAALVRAGFLASLREGPAAAMMALEQGVAIYEELDDKPH